MVSLTWELLPAKREFGQMPDKALDILVAGCWRSVGLILEEASVGHQRAAEALSEAGK